MQKRHARRTLAALAASAAIVAGLALGSPAPAFAADGVCTMATTAALNLRDAPGMHGKVIGVLTTDEAVAVSHKKNYWFTVDYHGQTGYCYGEYLGFTRGGYQDPNDTAGRNVMNDEVEGGATSTMNQLTVTAPLNVRTAPSMSGAIIGSLARGTVVSALEQTPDRWVRISFNGTDAWVFGDYLA